MSDQNRHYRTAMFNREVSTIGNFQSIYELAAKLVIQFSILQSRYSSILASLLTVEQMGQQLPAQPLLTLSLIYRRYQKAFPKKLPHQF